MVPPSDSATDGSPPVMLVLREATRSEAVRAQVRRKGGRAIALPAFTFKPVFDNDATITFLKAPRRYQRLFFVGPNGISALRDVAFHHNLPLPLNLTCAAPGPASRKALENAGFTNIIAPPGPSDFDTLLRHDLMGSLTGKRVALVQREGAPPAAAQSLSRKGCPVTSLLCYRRIANRDRFWLQLDDDTRRDINCILAFDTPSLQVLANEAGPDAERLKNLPVGVIHAQIKVKATELGFRNIIVADQGGDLLGQLMGSVNGQGHRMGS